MICHSDKRTIFSFWTVFSPLSSPCLLKCIDQFTITMRFPYSDFEYNLCGFFPFCFCVCLICSINTECHFMDSLPNTVHNTL